MGLFGNFGVGSQSDNGMGGGFFSNLRNYLSTAAQGYQARGGHSLYPGQMPMYRAQNPYAGFNINLNPYEPKPFMGVTPRPQPVVQDPRLTMPRGYDKMAAMNDPMLNNLFVRPMTPRAEARTRVGYGKLPVARAMTLR